MSFNNDGITHLVHGHDHNHYNVENQKYLLNGSRNVTHLLFDIHTSLAPAPYFSRNWTVLLLYFDFSVAVCWDLSWMWNPCTI